MGHLRNAGRDDEPRRRGAGADPAWVSYGPMVQLQQATPVHVTLPSVDDFRTAVAEEYVTPRTAHHGQQPNNPTGRVLTRRDRRHRAGGNHSLRAQRRDLRAHHLRRRYPPQPGRRAGMAERTIIVEWLLQGVRDDRAAGLAGRACRWPNRAHAANPEHYLGRQLATAGAVALQRPPECVHEMTAAHSAAALHARRAGRDPGIECAPIEGVFYVFPKFTATEKGSLKSPTFCWKTAYRQHVPGIAFGQAGEGHVRFSIASDMDSLERIVDRLARL
ncbi:MAG: hypothetical protein R3A10_05390 [Caldilineaceae bacterium]